MIMQSRKQVNDHPEAVCESTVNLTMVSMLEHEIHHLRQILAGRLILGDDGGCTWLGVEYGAGYPYMSRPWEIEAYYHGSLMGLKYLGVDIKTARGIARNTLKQQVEEFERLHQT